MDKLSSSRKLGCTGAIGVTKLVDPIPFKKESISASIKELEERISKDGILKILGILN